MYWKLTVSSLPSDVWSKSYTPNHTLHLSISFKLSSWYIMVPNSSWLLIKSYKHKNSNQKPMDFGYGSLATKHTLRPTASATRPDSGRHVLLWSRWISGSTTTSMSPMPPRSPALMAAWPKASWVSGTGQGELFVSRDGHLTKLIRKKEA